MSGYLARRPLVLGLAKVLVLACGQLPFVQSAPVFASRLIWSTSEDDPELADKSSLVLYLSIAAALVLLGGAFAGLTIALMGQDEIYLQVIRDSGEGKEKVYAGKVLRLLHRGKHWVLVTLLLSNVITNETLPIVLDRSLGGGWPAVLGSTVLIVIFGEVAPQSICVRYGLSIGAWMSPFVLFLMYVMAPIAWPTAKLLDYLLGEDHGTVYKKAGLKTLVSLHKSLGEAGQRLHTDEVTIITAVLDLKEKTVGSIMTPMDNVFTLSLDDVLDEVTMDDILSRGYSRIPVHHPDNDQNFVGMLLVKMLITYDPEDAKPVRDFALAALPETEPATSCLDIVNYFQEGKSHMVLVSDYPGETHGALGVVTLEDVIEELIGEEIIDESDVYVDIHKAIRRMTPAPRTRFPREKVTPVLVSHDSNTNEVQTDLVDINEDETLQPKDLHRTRSSDVIHRDPSTTQRRSSTNSNVTDGKLSRKVTNADDIKEHLKHLGPSNLASRPKSTRYASVKIKPGSGALNFSRPDTSARTTLPRRISEDTSAYSGGIGEGVLPSGGRLASDGVQALAVGYGTMPGSPHDKRPTSSHKAVQAGYGVLSDTEYSEETVDRKGLRPQMRTDHSNDTLGDLPNQPRSKSPYIQGRTSARSGSITENIVDTNGIRKVVLETTSSSDSNEDTVSIGATGNGQGFLKQTPDDDFSATGNAQNSDGDSAQQSNHSASKKKKRRRKRDKSAQGDESEPLLLS